MYSLPNMNVIRLAQFLNALVLYRFVLGEMHVDVTYEELVNLKADCNTSDNCKYQPLQDRLDIRNCNCAKFCTDVGTCCVDSPHRTVKRQPIQKGLKCTNIYGTLLYAFMIGECNPNWIGDPSISNQCVGDGESLSDPLLLVPVTSNRTGFTYKNYFCFRCNEEESQKLPRFWYVKIQGDNVLATTTVPVIQYDKMLETWKMLDIKEQTFADITLSVEVPDHLMNDVRICRHGVISTCATNWTDEIVRSKCSSYMGVIIIPENETKVLYRNAHCALCNYESLQGMLCSDMVMAKSPKRPFSFMLLVDVNQSDGDVVGKVQRCDDQSVYDPFFKKCRILKCALPNYSIVDGKCVEV